MGDLVSQKLRFSPAELQVIRRSVAPDTNDTEFDLFIAACGMYGLNPIRREIFAAVYDKDNAQKRQMAIIVEIAGRRVLAARCGNYRPASEPTRYIYRQELKSDFNPLGIEVAIVKLWTQDNDGRWHEVVGEAYWDEHAKGKEEWAYDESVGKRRPTGRKELNKTWREMPRLMIGKVAEAQALRKGWPEVFGGIYSDAEAPQGAVFDDDRTASDLVEQKETESRNNLIGRVGNEFPLQFEPMEPVKMVPALDVFDDVMRWARQADTVMQIKQFKSVNSDALRRFWADHKADALELNEQLEKRMTQIAEDAKASDAEIDAKAEKTAVGGDSGGVTSQQAEKQGEPTQRALIS